MVLSHVYEKGMEMSDRAFTTKNDAKDRFILRFQDGGQRVALKIRAAQNRRSMNSEILHLIDTGIAALEQTSAQVAA